ncbi:MAG TPA: hypothetical protein VFC39_15920 [Acidobacteriaceae bacterium]|nr:hypothetical protein [Acidobacteriaceae bacterium]
MSADYSYLWHTLQAVIALVAAVVLLRFARRKTIWRQLPLAFAAALLFIFVFAKYFLIMRPFTSAWSPDGGHFAGLQQIGYDENSYAVLRIRRSWYLRSYKVDRDKLDIDFEGVPRWLNSNQLLVPATGSACGQTVDGIVIVCRPHTELR